MQLYSLRLNFRVILRIILYAKSFKERVYLCQNSKYKERRRKGKTIYEGVPPSYILPVWLFASSVKARLPFLEGTREVAPA